MNHHRRASPLSLATLVCFFLFGGLVSQRAAGQEFDRSLFDGMRWRLIGPFRGGRALTAAGVPGHPNRFYFGAVGGGVWRTINAGRTWEPIFDGEPIASIGAIAVAPSNPDVIYVGAGEADMRSDISYGDGMYKSTDGGKTWTSVGLRDTRQIGRILVSPSNPDVVFVAALGHAYGPNAERGVFRSTDGGRTWRKMLYKDENTGAIDLAFDPRNPKVIYATLWQTRRPPWNVYPPSNGPGSGLYKSTDGGDTWAQLTGHGLPSEGLGRMGIAVAPSDPNRVYLIVDAKEGGLYRSDDAGGNWRRAGSESRIWGRGWYFGGVTVDPKDPDTVYVANTSLYRSQDGGQSFTAIKGAPGGDDYHSLWIEPDDPERMILSSDQGVIVSVDRGKSWTSWYNQPTGQFYHVSTDNRFPYWVYGAQQDSGAAGTASRSNHRTISFRDWLPISVGGESGYIVPDPLNPGILYGGEVTRYNITTGQDQDVPPMLAHPGSYRRTWTMPLVFSSLDPHALYFGTQMLFRTLNGGQSWQVISSDLTRDNPSVPPNLDRATAEDIDGGGQRGIIYTVAPSPVRAGEIWIGTDDGFIQLTRDDGKTWQNVTPSGLTPWSKVTLIEASRFDADTAYAAVDRHRLDDLKPYIYRTHDGGKTWQLVASGIPKGSYANAVREDPARKGLLYAGTETGVFVSFNDGGQWQPLQLNLPTASVRDLVIHDNDLVVATHGRAFWVLDDVTPLRQISKEVANSEAYLFEPEIAWRIRPGSDEGTPLPPDVPGGENPPNGAVLDYYLKSAAPGPLTIEIFDATGKPVRRYSSADQPERVDPQKLPIPAFWVHPPEPPAATPGMHRFVWDLRYPRGPGPRNPFFEAFGFGGGPWVLPGEYTVKLTVSGHNYTRPLTVKMDPRVQTPPADLVRQFEMTQEILAAQTRVVSASREASRLRSSLESLRPRVAGRAALADVIEALDRRTKAILGPEPANPFASSANEAATDRTSLRYLSGALGEVERVVESADVAPTEDAVTALAQEHQAMNSRLAQWNEVKTRDLPQLNSMLGQANLPPISLEERQPGPAE